MPENGFKHTHRYEEPPFRREAAPESESSPLENQMDEAFDDELEIGTDVVYIKDASGTVYKLVESDGIDAKISYTNAKGQEEFKNVSTDELVSVEAYNKLKEIVHKTEIE